MSWRSIGRSGPVQCDDYDNCAGGGGCFGCLLLRAELSGDCRSGRASVPRDRRSACGSYYAHGPRTVQHLGGRCPGFGFRNTPYGACCRICRLFCSGYGGGCLLASAIRTRAPYAPMGAPRRRGESQGRHRGAPSFALFLIIGAYGAVFGFLHVVPLALSLDVSSRVTAFLFGAVAALGLFSATLRQSDGTDVVRLWNRFYQYVFPIVTVAALLGPLTMDTEFLPLLILQACALYYFDVLLAVASYTIARVIKASPTQVFARAFLVKSAGFFLGCLVGFGVHESVVLDETRFQRHRCCHLRDTVPGHFPHQFGEVCQNGLGPSSSRGRPWKVGEPAGGVLPPSSRPQSLASLNHRQAEILDYLVAGKRPKEISEMLVVSITTVRSHVRAIYAKTGVHSHGELMHLLDEK